MIQSLCILLACVPQASTRALKPLPANSLARAAATFEALDSNHDGRLDPKEIARLDKAASALAPACDDDRDGMIDRDEFLVLYRKILLASGLRAAPDLETESARVEALHRARAALSGRRISTERRSSVVSTPAAVPSVRASIAVDDGTSAGDERIRGAFGRIERQALAGRSVPQEFEALRSACLDSKHSGDPNVQLQPMERSWRELDLELRRQGALVVVRLCALREAVREFQRQPVVGPPGQPVERSAASSPAAEPLVESPRAIRLRALLDDLQGKLDRHEDVHLDLRRLRALACSMKPVAGPGAPDARAHLFDRAAKSGLSRTDLDELRALLLAPGTRVPAARGPVESTPNSAPAAPVVDPPAPPRGPSPRANGTEGSASSAAPERVR